MGENNAGENWRFVKQVINGRWFSVFASFLIMIGNGSTYLFGTYSKVIKTQFDYTQTQVNTLGFAKDLGTNLGIIAGLLAEVAPPWVLFLIGSFSNFLSYFIIWLAITNHIPKPQFWLMFVSVCISALSQNFPNTAVMVINVKNFPDRRGIILGLLKGFVGLGGAILTQIYLAIYGPKNPSNLVLLLSWLPSIVTLFFFLSIRTIKQQKYPHELNVFYHFLAISITTAVFILFLTVTQKEIVFSHGGYVGGVAVVAVLLCSPLLIAIKEELFLFKLNKQKTNPSVSISIHEEKQTNLEPSSHNDTQIEKQSNNTPQRGEDFSILQAIFSKDMALIFIATFSGCGSSVAAIDNLGQIAESLKYPGEHINVFVSWISIFNFFGRVSSGFISETVLKKYRLPRPLMFGLSQVLILIGMLSIAFPFSGSIYGSSLIIGFGFGAQIPLLFTIISDLFGLKHYSTLLNCGNLAVPLGSYILNVHVVGKMYDEEAIKGGNVKNGKGLTCTGNNCFSGAFMILSAVTLIGVMASFVLAYRTREFYKHGVWEDEESKMESNHMKIDEHKNSSHHDDDDTKPLSK